MPAGSLAGLALLVASAPARAADHGILAGAQVSGGWDVDVRYYATDDLLPGFEDRPLLLDYGEEVQRINLLLNASQLQVGLQVDQVALFLDRYRLDGQLVYEQPLVGDDLLSPVPDAWAGLEKVWVLRRFALGGARGDLRLGDAYAAFGRGLALNLVRNPDLDVDTSVRGAGLQLVAGDWEFRALGGTTNLQQVQQENPNTLLRRGTPTLLGGASLARYGLGAASVGAHLVAATFARTVETDPLAPVALAAQPLDVLVGGLWAGGSLAGVDLYGEGALFDYRSSDFFDGEPPRPGRALYGSATAYLGPLSILAEVKDNRDAERINTFVLADGYELAAGPTLEYERAITEDSSFAVNSNDITGVRLAGDWSARSGRLTPRLSLAAFRDRDVAAHFNATPETIGHVVAGVDWLGDEVQVLANAGGRVDVRDGPYGADRLVHGDLAAKFPVGRFHAELNADAWAFWWGVNQPQQSDYREASVSAGFTVVRPLTLTLYVDYSDNPLVDSVGNLTDSLYGAAELIWDVDGTTRLKVFYGAYKAGIRCSGGQCRSLPGFEGARASFTTTF